MEPAGMQVCFEIVTKDRAVIDTEPELHEDIKAATRAAAGWMEMKGQTLQIQTYEGHGVSVRVDEIVHITAMPLDAMSDLFAERAQALADFQKGTINNA